ncbi:DUF3558 domain-containing protein [Pseudonocardia sp. GCM10023141]|uniref:DUF3558 domain-containing protein n=1 Tax=Pseudonocardia sp. GCM10023141 TaxID=3252653 RepID=UPI00360A6B9E
MNRLGRLGAACLSVLLLTGCTTISSSGGPVTQPGVATASSTGQPSTAPAKPSPRLSPIVREPKDARGIAPCALLTAVQLGELGLIPESAQPSTSGAAQVCGWRSVDPGNAGGIQINTNPTLPSLDGIYLVRDTFDVFEPIEVSGHPAVHADQIAGPVCTIYTAIADYQGVSTDGNLAGRPLADPCGPSRRMAELILSNLPPLR